MSEATENTADGVLAREADKDVELAEPEYGTLGIERWVQFGFVALFALLFWVLDRIVTAVWDRFAEPQSVVIAGLSVCVAAVATMAIYKNDTLNSFVHESATELSKVTWPSRSEARSATVVVVVTSIIAAAILFVFDGVWSGLSDYVYK